MRRFLCVFLRVWLLGKPEDEHEDFLFGLYASDDEIRAERIKARKARALAMGGEIG